MKIDKRIIPLAIGGLGIGTTEFTVMGLFRISQKHWKSVFRRQDI
jgi:predicted MFS family arabinose efflux permease